MAMRSIILLAVPTLTALLGGIFWFTRKKRSSNQLEYPKPPDKKPSESPKKSTDINAEKNKDVRSPVAKPVEVAVAEKPVDEPSIVPVEETVVASKAASCLSAKVNEESDWAPETQSSSWVEQVENALQSEISSEKKVDENEDDVIVGRRTLRADSGHVESPQSEASSSQDSGSDVHSELSSDSGNASSIIENGSSLRATTTPPVLEEEDEADSAESAPEGNQLYEFDMPSHLCGMFIGRGGAAIKQLRQKTGVEVLVRPKQFTEECQLVILEGTNKQITKALDLVRQKFPKSRFAELDLSPAQPEVSILPPQMMQMNLPTGVTSDVVVSSVVSPNHVFLQQPTHPSFPQLESLNQFMSACYSQDSSIPHLPRPIEIGVICAAPMYNSWYRAQVVQTYPETDGVDIKYVDYGGYAHVEGSSLRQIRSDFTSMPFQSTECYLANVTPPADAGDFAPESAACLEELVQGQLLQAEVTSFEEDGVPYINLYCTDESRHTFLLNRVLVEQGIAQWYEESA